MTFFIIWGRVNDLKMDLGVKEVSRAHQDFGWLVDFQDVHHDNWRKKMSARKAPAYRVAEQHHQLPAKMAAGVVGTRWFSVRLALASMEGGQESAEENLLGVVLPSSSTVPKRLFRRPRLGAVSFLNNNELQCGVNYTFITSGFKFGI